MGVGPGVRSPRTPSLSLPRPPDHPIAVLKAPVRFVQLALLLLLPACSTVLALDEPFEAPPPTPAPAPYRISPGDKLEIEFARMFHPIDEYKLGIGDTLSIQVQRHEELSLTTSVAPDGTIAYYHLGRIQAAGKSLDEVREEITTGLADAYPDPVVDVFLVEGDNQTSQFIEMLLKNPNGATRQVTVDPAGRVSLPGIGSVEVKGMTILEAEKTFNDQLQNYLPSMQVIVNSTLDAGSNYSVVGEVNKPGTFTLTGNVSLVEALAAAGWETEYGDLDRVLLMSVGPDNVAYAEIYDVGDALSHGNPLPMVRIRPKDTVLVLSTAIGNTNRAIDLYIKRNLPINVGASYRLNNPNK